MIINLRGTSGSGKTTLVRSIVQDAARVVKFHEEGRKQPIGYALDLPGSTLPVALIGHYETACGGCDTIPSMDKIFELVRWSADNGFHVIFEGLLISADLQRTLALHTEGRPLTVIGLSTPLEECLASVNKRRQTAFEGRLERIQAENSVREEAGRKLLPLPEPKGDVNPKNTESKYKGVTKSMEKLIEAGVTAEWHDRASALARLQGLLQ